MNKITETKLDYQRLENIVYGTVKSRLLLVAIELGVFDVLRTAKSAKETAEELASNPQNVLHMLRALTACSLLEYSNGVFKNSSESDAFLVADSSSFIGQWLLQAASIFEPILDDLKNLIINGPSQKKPENHMNSEEMCEFYTHAHAQTGLAGIAKKTADLVQALPEYNEFKTMLDLGGGPGLNSIAIVQNNPGLKSVIFDRKSVVNIAQQYIINFGMTEKIKTKAGDYCCDDLGTGYDFILASDTMYYTTGQLDNLASKIYEALNPGGIFMGIHGVLTEDKTSPQNMVLGMLPDALMAQGELPNSGFLAPSLLRVGFVSVHTRQMRMISSLVEIDIARKTKNP